MHSTCLPVMPRFSSRLRRLALAMLAPATAALGRWYGGRSATQGLAGHLEYGIGAALAGFTPASRR